MWLCVHVYSKVFPYYLVATLCQAPPRWFKRLVATHTCLTMSNMAMACVVCGFVQEAPPLPYDPMKRKCCVRVFPHHATCECCCTCGTCVVRRITLAVVRWYNSGTLLTGQKYFYV